MAMVEKKSDERKRAVGYAAANLIEDGMLVGLGTGSTAAFFIERLITRSNEGLSLRGAVATSERSAVQARAGGLIVMDMDLVSSIDITVDGADEIDSKKRMIKGGGGALLREKIISSSSKEMVVIIDESKLSETLGSFPLPVEIVRFGAQSTLARLISLGLDARLRVTDDGGAFVTDEGHYIADVYFNGVIEAPEALDSSILSTVGVVETGFFFGMAGRVIIGRDDGSIEILE